MAFAFCNTVVTIALYLALIPSTYAQDATETSQPGTSGSQEAPPPQGPPPTGGAVPRQDENKNPQAAVKPERWNLFWQATSVGQYHGTFTSPYQGPLSLENRTEADVSLTTTLFLAYVSLAIRNCTSIRRSQEDEASVMWQDLRTLQMESCLAWPVRLRSRTWQDCSFRKTSASGRRKSHSRAKKISWPENGP